MPIDPQWHPNWPQWQRKLVWFFRNPPTLFPRTDALPGQATWNPKGGWLFLRHRSGLPFVSYRGKRIECYAGWRPSGAFGIAFRHANARGSEKIQ